MTVLVALLLAVAVLLLPGREGGEPSGPAAVTEPSDAAASSAASAPLTREDVATCTDLLAVALSGGADLRSALEVVADVVTGEARRELRVVAAAMRWGVPSQECWALVSPGWAQTASAFVLADRAGVAPTALLTEAASALRRDQARRAAVRAGALSARIALPLGLTFLPGFVLTTVVPVVLGLARTLVVT